MIARTLIALSLLVTTPAMAQDFSEGSNAREWGLAGEVKSTFSAKVVDILCELSGDCADNCGNGNRQLGLVREADNKLIAVLKNRQAAFNGAAEDLLPYCNKPVDVDGVMIGEDEDSPSRVYMVQFIRDKGAAEWNKTTLWTKRWAEKHPEAKGKGPWFRRDPRVKKQIEATGYLGKGLDYEAAYLKELLEE
ncbi:MAG: hypothetical protein AAF903_09305 [Pseudomonadota bacterium]